MGAPTRPSPSSSSDSIAAPPLLSPASSKPAPTATESDETAPLLPPTCDDAAEYESDWGDALWHKRPSIMWLLPPFCLFTMAIGGTAVPKLNIILTLVCREYLSTSLTPTSPSPIIGGDNNPQCQIPAVHSRTSNFMLVLMLVAGILGAFTCPPLGALSDRIGRRGLLAFSSFGLFVGELTTVAVVRWPEVFGIEFLLLGAVIDGLCGSFMLGMALSFSYAADCTVPRHRATAFGAFQGCLYLGIAVGPVLGGLLVEWTGDILSVFYVALVTHVFYMLYMIFILPESLPKRRQLEAREKRAAQHLASGGKSWYHTISPRGLLKPLRIFYPTGPGSSPRLRLNMVLLATIDCILFGVGMGAMSVVIMYSERQFGWNTLDSSIFLSITNSVRVAVLFCALPVLITIVRRGASTERMRIGSDMLDINLIRVAVITEALGYFLYALAPNGVLFTIAGSFVSLGSMGSPTIQSTLTKHIPKSKTGELLGAFALLHSLSRVVAPTVFNSVYAWTVASVPQTVFVCLASTFSVAFVSSWLLRAHITWEAEEGEEGEEWEG